MKYTNSWKSKTKQADKIDIILRVGKITFIKFTVDVSRKTYMLTLLNFTIKI
jgi:hypothetical protein